MQRKVIALVFALLLPICGNTATAAGGGSDTSVSIGDVKRYVDRGKYDRAIAKAKTYLESNSRSADAYNYIGYSLRQLGKYAEAKKAYDTALSIDPNHVGAHEYVGELHIKLGNLEKAKQHLADLTRICGNCEEQQMLAKKIANPKAGG